MIDIPHSMIVEKFEDVESKTNQNVLLCMDEEVKYLLRQSEIHFKVLPGVLEIPIGCCHGDLISSDIPFSGNNHYLIDLLDSLIESPLLGMVRIRQDTRYRRSTLMYEGEFDGARSHVVSDTIDHQLGGALKQYIWYCTFYYTLQLMNFLRILQYAKEKKTVAYLKKAIQSILNYE